MSNPTTTTLEVLESLKGNKGVTDKALCDVLNITPEKLPYYKSGTVFRTITEKTKLEVITEIIEASMDKKFLDKSCGGIPHALACMWV